MIRVFCGHLQNAICHSLHTPEQVFDDLDNKFPFEQFKEFDKLIKKYPKGFCVITNSAFVLNYLNLLIPRGDIKYDDLEVLYFTKDSIRELKSLNEQFIDTMPLNDAIQWIYDERKRILNSN